MRPLAFAIALSLPTAAFAAGGMDDTPVTPTETTTVCENGQIWDAESKSCVSPRESRLDNDTLYGAAREFAHAGDHDSALAALAAMSEGDSDRVLTYIGFVHRKAGDRERAFAAYAAALAKNPDNILARSYLGMALLEEGDRAAARAELSEIRKRGGRNTWPEASLRLALESGGYSGY